MHSDDLEALFRFLVRNHDLSMFIGVVELILKPYSSFNACRRLTDILILIDNDN